MAKYVILLLLGVALTSAAPGPPESTQNDPKEDFNDQIISFPSKNINPTTNTNFRPNTLDLQPQSDENDQNVPPRTPRNIEENPPNRFPNNAPYVSSYEELYELYNFPKYKEAVLMLGNTGSGKTVVASLLTGANLTSVVACESCSVFNITDQKGLISKSLDRRLNLRINSFVDVGVGSNTTFYDLPGFRDSEASRHYVPISLVLEKTFPFTESVKVLLVMDYGSVRFGESPERLCELLNKVGKLVDNVDRYGAGIGMVVNKVNYTQINDDGTIEVLSEENVIQKVAVRLVDERNRLEEENKSEFTDVEEDEKSFNERKIKLIDVLLEHGNNNVYKRIGVLHRPQEAGSIDGMEFLMREKEHIKHIVNQNLQFVDVNRFI